MSDVFISYARRDGSFVESLQEALRKAGRSPWIDVHGIRPAEDFMQAICDAIDRAQAFVFVLSPDSVSSKICARELEHAEQGHKRLVPVVCREVQDSLVPAALRSLNWIRLAADGAPRKARLLGMFEPSPFELLVRQLIDAVDTDLPWVRMHTRLLWRATEWNSNGRGKDHLLRGKDLTTVLSMVGDEAREPKLNRLQLSYIDASKDTEAASRPLQEAREELARLSGQIESVKRMQSAALPSADEVFRGEQRFELFAICEPAGEVGGDLCDYYRLDDDHVLIVVADVAGKGLAAGYFAKVVKVLIKSAAMRGRVRLNELMQEVDRDISRDNPESLFVTAFIGLLDAQSGQLTYCSAGCERPLLVSTDAERLIADVAEAEGPPLCVIEGFQYAPASMQLKPGDILCVFTDGVTEVADPSGKLYGRDALKESVRSTALDGPIRESCETLMKELKAFMSCAEPTDDLTFLMLRWNGLPMTP